VVGFPLGANTTETKTAETRDAIKNGATEIDMVMSIGLFKSGLFDEVKKDIVAVVDASAGLPVKVILETCLLTNNEISKACKISVEAGAAYVKTSTGFSSGGASVEAVLAMKAAVGDSCKIKASGGIRSRSDALAMIEAGAVRIGTSSGVAIVSG
jgi:deoxyribose-phosphate aldolase